MGGVMKRRILPAVSFLIILMFPIYLAAETVMARYTDSVMYYFPNCMYDDFFMLILAAGLFILISSLKIRNEKVKKLLSITGNCTLGVYIVHRYYAELLCRYWDHPLWIVAAAYLLSAITVSVIKKTRWGSIIF